MDVSDVERGIVSNLAAALFAGPYNPGDNVPSLVTGNPQIRLYRGWPVPQSLDADLATGNETLPDAERIVNVTVFSMPGMTRPLVTRERQWFDLPSDPPSLTASFDETGATFAGTPSVDQVVGISLTPSNTGVEVGYAYRCHAGDTLSTLATTLAHAIPGASASGSTVTLPSGSEHVWAGAVRDGAAIMELRHQEQDFLVSIWAPTPRLRDSVSSAVDVAMASIDRLTIDNVMTGPVCYRSTKTIDAQQLSREWVRNLTYCIAYPTSVTKVLPKVLFPWLSIEVNNLNGVAIRTSTVGPKYPGG